MNKHLKIIEAKLDFYGEWLNRPATQSMVSEDIRFIDEDLKSNALGAWYNIADSLGRLATWYGARGLVGLNNNSNDGWRDVHRSWKYRALSLRIRILRFKKDAILGEFQSRKTLTTEASLSALCLAYSLMFNCEFERNFFQESLFLMLGNNKVIPEKYWNYHFLEPFTIHLSYLSQNEVTGNLNRKLGVYQNVIDSWLDPSHLNSAISAICDFHCSRIEDTSNNFTAEFRNPPFDLVPVEILAVYSVRANLGLDTPKVEHPLLQIPFITPDGSPYDIQDELLDRIEAKL